MERITLNNDKELGEIATYLHRICNDGSAKKLYEEIEEMKNQMINGYCHFLFKKVNGEVRDAYGTRATDIIEANSSPKDCKTKKRNTGFNGTFAYFDMIKNDWRCFRIDTLIEIDRDFVI